MEGVLFLYSRLIHERKGNGEALHSTMLKLNNRSDMYLYWVTIIPSKFCSISSPRNCFKSPKTLISNALWRAVLMTEIEVTVLPVISKSSTYKTIIIKLPSYYCIYTFGSDLHLWKFCKRRKASTWNTTLLGPVLTRIMTSLACKPKMNQNCSHKYASCISPHEDIHADRHT